MSNTAKLNNCPKCGRPIPAAAPQALCPKCVLLGAAQPTEGEVPATATSEIPSLERISAAFPQLEILELIGRGGMGFVFKARQPHLDRFVALKLLPDKLAGDAKFAERFNREGRVLARLNHPNIVSVFDFGQTGGFYYLLMECVDGVNLRQAMRTGRFSPGEALAIVPKICEALQYAHEQGILHRDIKPENILLDTRGRVKIADFGIAKLVGEDRSNVNLTQTGAALGTPHYMAPEQLEKPTDVDHRADIYSLGVVFYEMLTGELPLGRFAPPSARTPVNATVDEVVLRTLEKDRELRFQSAGEMKTEVEHLGDGGGGVGAVGQTRHLSRMAIIGAVLVGVSLMSALAWLTPIFGPVSIGSKDLWRIAVGVILPGLGGTLLGWLGLSEIREQPGTFRGLPLASFAALAWPILLIAGVALGLSTLLLRQGRATPSRNVGRLMVFVLPAGTIAFCFWAIHATMHWGARQQFGQRRGVLRWIFAAVLVIGLGAVLVVRQDPESPVALDTPVPAEAEAAPTVTPAATVGTGPDAGPAMIQFTFTSVDLRDDADGQWLTMDYVEQVRGSAERTFRYDAQVPGFTATTRVVSFMSDAKAGFPPVRHQRVFWKLPDSFPLGEAQALRELVAREWAGKSVAIALGDERVLFKTLVPSGGTLACALGARAPGPVPTKERAVATLRLIGAIDHKNIAIARLESLRSHPLHRLVVRLRGPEIADQASRAPSLLSGPLLVPSVDAETSDYFDGSKLWGTNKARITSAISFECPGDYSLQFVLPDENLARDAARQIAQTLEKPARMELGRSLTLFTADQWSGWLEIHPFPAEPGKLSLFLHPGKSPADVPGTNRIESAVVTVPPNHDLVLTVQPVINGMNTSPAFQGTIPGIPNKPGIYWLTWYGLPNPQSVDKGSQPDWELQIHDEHGREIQRVRAPEGTGIQWKRRWLTENRKANSGQQIRQMIFEKNLQEPGRGPTLVLLDMLMRRQDPLQADQ